jgi:hypothetical protein
VKALGLLLVALLAILILSETERRPTNNGLPLVAADYQRCIMVHPGPIKPRPKPVLYPNLSEIS